MPMLRPATCALLLSAWVAPAAAFESNEHERLGNLAFHFALKIHCPVTVAPSADCSRLRIAFTDPLDPGAPEPDVKLTYGMVVRCVDHYLTPEKLIAGREDMLFSKPDTPPTVATVVPGSVADFASARFAEHCRDGVFNFSATQAAHSNHAHFQAELIASQNLYHRLAMALARDGKLFGALFTSAMSDHYLHDFFAPGHIGTFRSHMSDIYSNAMHDSINASGGHLRFRRGHYRALLRSLAAPGGVALDQVPLEPQVRVQLRCLARQSGIDEFMRPHDRRICRDDEAKPDDTAWPAGVAHLGDLLAAVDAPGPDEATARVPMQGDGMLWRPELRQQRVLMLALQLRAILDVLRANQPGNQNWFADGAWRSDRLADGSGALISATIDGGFAFRLRFPSSDENGSAQADDDDVIRIAHLHKKVLQLVPRGQQEIVLSTGINYEMPHFGKMQGRASVSFEVPMLALLNDGIWKINYGAALGAFRFREGKEWGSGLSFRPGFVLSQSETFVTVPLRWFRFQGDGRPSVWRSSWGLRVDQGFSSFMTVYLQYSASPFRQEDGRIDRGSVFGAGVVFAAPLCRVPKVSGWIC